MIGIILNDKRKPYATRCVLENRTGCFIKRPLKYFDLHGEFYVFFFFFFTRLNRIFIIFATF